MSDQTIIKAADNTNASGAIIGLAGWAASVNWIGWAGVLIALAGFWVSFHYQQKRGRREQAESERRSRHCDEVLGQQRHEYAVHDQRQRCAGRVGRFRLADRRQQGSRVNRLRD